MKSHSLVKYFSYIITAILGSVAYLAINGANQNFMPLISQVSWIQLPIFSAFAHWHFSFALVTPFVIASLISVCKVIGSVSVLQQLKVEAVIAHDFTNISKANLADGLGTFLCGLIGGTGVNASSTCMALSVETRVNNRYVAYVTALMMAIVAVCGKLMFLLLMIPSVIIGGLLIVLGGTLILYGLKMSLRFIMADNVAWFKSGLHLTVIPMMSSGGHCQV
ncbi:MAG: hypothetical protein GY821_16435 [Gammaproteobacteria bacterium]|nr:hypothetical protein [Gammaproteobacteria bacterium]